MGTLGRAPKCPTGESLNHLAFQHTFQSIRPQCMLKCAVTVGCPRMRGRAVIYCGAPGSRVDDQFWLGRLSAAANRAYMCTSPSADLAFSARGSGRTLFVNNYCKIVKLFIKYRRNYNNINEPLQMNVQYQKLLLQFMQNS